MTKQQEGFVDFNKLSLETIVKSDGGDSKDNKDMQNIKALHSELDELNINLESKISIIQEIKSALLCSEQEISTKTINKNQVFGRLSAIKVDIEDRENQINLLDGQIPDVNNRIGEAERHRSSIREDDYKYTEWWYPFENVRGTDVWFVHRHQNPYHYHPGHLHERVMILLHREQGHHHLYHQRAYDYIYHKPGNGTGWDRLHKERNKIPNPFFIETHHDRDHQKYNDARRDADANLKNTIARKEEIEVQIQRLEQEIKEKEGQKIGVEAELQRMEEALMSVEIEKEKVEVKLQELLQEQQGLEIRCSELKELISKEEARVAEEVQKSEETVGAMCTKLLKVMELVEKGNVTEENRQLLIETRQNLEDIDQEGEFTAYLEKGDGVLDTYFPDSDEAISTKIGFQEREVQGNYIYLT